MEIAKFSPNETLEILTNATHLNELTWVRVLDYMFLNGRNKALLNYIDMFTKAPFPKGINDIPKTDSAKSYYCEYEGAAFCLLFLTQVLKENDSATSFYYLMVQRHPYDNFGYYSQPTDSESELFKILLALVESQVKKSWIDNTVLNKALTKLHQCVKNSLENTDFK